MSGYYQYQRREMIPFLPETYRRVLEIGCGEGAFRTCLHADAEVWGIEPVSTAAGVAESSYTRILNGRYKDVYDDLPDAYFDLVVCNDVIEHMTSHDRFFATIQSKMNPQAMLVGSIPNVRYLGNVYNLLIKRDWQYTDDGILDRTHLRFFTEKSLKRTFADHGLKIDQFRGINSDKVGKHFIGTLCKASLYCLLTVMTFGLARDVSYLQFGFRVHT